MVYEALKRLFYKTKVAKGMKAVCVEQQLHYLFLSNEN